MSKKDEIWAVGMWASAVLEWCKRIVGRYWRFAGGIADQLPIAERENQLKVTSVMDVDLPIHVDFAGKRVELREFIKVLSIGDRIRLFCDDGVLVAEKISETRFKFIHTEIMAEFIH
jgi:hypothetical protein